MVWPRTGTSSTPGCERREAQREREAAKSAHAQGSEREGSGEHEAEQLRDAQPEQEAA